MGGYLSIRTPGGTDDPGYSLAGYWVVDGLSSSAQDKYSNGMKLNFPIAPGIDLLIASGLDRASGYPTSRIQKGLVLRYEGQDLSEEAIGLGVPIVKRGLQAVFPSEVDLYLHGGYHQTQVSARYKLNLEERIARNGNSSIKNRSIYTIKNSLAAIIRHIPFMRNLLTNTSNFLRTSMSWESTYEVGDFSTYVVLTYTIRDEHGKIGVELVGGDFLSKSISEIIVMNELGAHHFEKYQESNGIVHTGDEIGCWDPVIGETASFIDQVHNVAFNLHQVKGAKLYRGRELIETRLAWAGFGYSFPPSLKSFQYEITITKLS